MCAWLHGSIRGPNPLNMLLQLTVVAGAAILLIGLGLYAYTRWRSREVEVVDATEGFEDPEDPTQPASPGYIPT